MTEWRNGIKKILREAGGYARETVFLLSDNQIKQEEFLQDLDSLLNSGEVPNLYNVDEQQEILEVNLFNYNEKDNNIELQITFLGNCQHPIHRIALHSQH